LTDDISCPQKWRVTDNVKRPEVEALETIRGKANEDYICQIYLFSVTTFILWSPLFNILLN
jgi:hypothetical protein